MTYEQFLTDPTVPRHSEWVDDQVVPLLDGETGPTAAWPSPVRLTLEQFLTSPAVPDCAEWVDGEVIPMPPIANPQADIGRLLFIAVGFFVEHHGLGTIRAEPFHVRVRPDLPMRSPDLMFIAKRRMKRIRRLYLDGPADLIVEVVSPESQTRDRIHKFGEYELGGVPEYWLLDPDRRTADFFRRGRNGRYRPMPLNADGVFHSKALPGVWLKVDQLWRRPLPSAADLLRDWGVL